MSDFELGQRVRFSRPIIRMRIPTKQVEVTVKLPYGQEWKEKRHVNVEWTVNPFDGPAEGIIVGKRTLSNGYREYHYDAGYEYGPAEHFTAYLVAFDLRRKPVHVLPEHIEAVA
ncbi:hypothetical protein SEA_BRAYBEAST_46 [Arthrobacter phage BrayBeast]